MHGVHAQIIRKNKKQHIKLEFFVVPKPKHLICQLFWCENFLYKKMCHKIVSNFDTNYKTWQKLKGLNRSVANYSIK